MADDASTRGRTLVATPAELAAAREARGMSQLDISQRIKLQIKQVDALEQGRWEALPGRSFVRGALRSYGRLLDVDVAPLLESIGGFAEPAPVHGLKPLDASLSHAAARGRRGSPIPWVVACLVGVVALVLYFGSDPDGERVRAWLPATGLLPGQSPATGVAAAGGSAARSAAADATSSAPATAGASSQPSGAGAPGSGTSSSSVLSALQVLSPKATPPVAGEAVPGSAAVPTAGGGSAQSSPGASTPLLSPAGSASAPGPAAAPVGMGAGTVAPVPGPVAARPGPDAAAANTKVMQFRARDDSWVEVRQADGSALHNALLKAGSSIELKGSPPYRLIIGNASRLELTYEGKPQDLAPHTRANNIARLQLQ